MSDIIFKIGPRINASGRIDNGKQSVDLLVEKDYSKALQQAKHIDEYNEQRKDIDKQMTEEANQIVSRIENQKQQSSIVVYDENWKKGVVGIVASRLTEIYFRPTVVLTKDGTLQQALHEALWALMSMLQLNIVEICYLILVDIPMQLD